MKTGETILAFIMWPIIFFGGSFLLMLFIGSIFWKIFGYCVAGYIIWLLVIGIFLPGLLPDDNKYPHLKKENFKDEDIEGGER